MYRWTAVLLMLAASAIAAARGDPPPLATVAQADLERMAGNWYVVASLPGSGNDEPGSQLELVRAGKGYRVVARYFDKTFDEAAKTREGTISVLDAPANAHWQLRYPWSLAQDWNLLAVDAEYRYALVGDASRRRAWILARERYLGDEHFQELLDVLAAQGYESTRLLKVPQGSEFIGMPGFHGG